MAGQEKTYYYLEAANGMTVRVPEDKLESWQAAQDKIRADMQAGKTPKPDPQMVERLLSLMGQK